jgi:hypothetical protein
MIAAAPGRTMAKAPPAKRTKRSPPKARRSGDDATAFAALATAALRRGEPDAIPDASLHAALAAAVKLFAAKAERRGGEVRPFADDAVTATETVVAVCAMIRAADLSPFDVAMWFHRLPRT